MVLDRYLVVGYLDPQGESRVLEILSNPYTTLWGALTMIYTVRKLRSPSGLFLCTRL